MAKIHGWLLNNARSLCTLLLINGKVKSTFKNNFFPPESPVVWAIQKISTFSIKKITISEGIVPHNISIPESKNWHKWHVNVYQTRNCLNKQTWGLYIYMIDSDWRPASNRHPILKSMSDFYITDICTSDLCPFFQILKSMSFLKFSNLCPLSNPQIDIQWRMPQPINRP
jgi:hypothetical protein